MASIYDLFRISPDEQEAIAFARNLTPAEASLADRRLYQQRAVEAGQGLARTALGLPQPPQADRQAAAAELTALAQRVRPGTAEFYEAAIPILQKYNMPAEAEAMEKSRLGLDTAKFAQSPLLKLQHDKELLLKRPDAASPNVQAAIAAIDRKIEEFGTRQSGGSDPELIRLQRARAATTDPAERAELETAIRNHLAKVGPKDTSFEERRVAVTEAREARAEKKDERKASMEDAAIVSALQGTVRAVDNELQAAKQLLAHPGLTRIVGPRYGAAPLTGLGIFGEDAAGAGALYQTLEGQLFIRALQDLKATSKTGASGLGQLTEREGDKIQQAKAALSRQQPDQQFRNTLTGYIALLEATRGVATKELGGVQAEVPAQPAPVAAPAKPNPRAVTAPAAAPAARTFKSTLVR